MSWLVAVVLCVASEPAPPEAGAPWWSEVELRPTADAITDFSLRVPEEGPITAAFSVPRVQAGLDVGWRGAEVRVLVEGAYATQGGALVGVAGDSVVVRLREAWAGYRWRFLEAKLGMVPTLLVPELERGWLFRELGPTALEGYRLLAPADLGALVRATLPGGFGWVGAAVTNGEGYTSRELNPGKNVEVAAAVHPLPAGRWWPVTLVAGASFGSSGLPEIATHRFGGAAMWAGRQLGVSAGLFGIFGLDGDAAQRGYVFEVTARGMLFEHVLLAARWQYLRRSTTFDDAVMDVMGAVGGRLSFVELFFAVGRTTGIGAARTALPGNDATQVRLVARARWPELNP